MCHREEGYSGALGRCFFASAFPTGTFSSAKLADDLLGCFQMNLGSFFESVFRPLSLPLRSFVERLDELTAILVRVHGNCDLTSSTTASGPFSPAARTWLTPACLTALCTNTGTRSPRVPEYKGHLKSARATTLAPAVVSLLAIREGMSLSCIPCFHSLIFSKSSLKSFLPR